MRSVGKLCSSVFRFYFLHSYFLHNVFIHFCFFFFCCSFRFSFQLSSCLIEFFWSFIPDRFLKFTYFFCFVQLVVCSFQSALLCVSLQNSPITHFPSLPNFLNFFSFSSKDIGKMRMRTFRCVIISSVFYCRSSIL